MINPPDLLTSFEEKQLSQLIEVTIDDMIEAEQKPKAEWEYHKHDCPCSDCWDPPTDE